jgi:predicted AAA+ superfamily ATPase
MSTTRVARRAVERLLRSRLRLFPAVVLLGPRQCGKSTLAHELAKGASAKVFDLERPADLRRLQAAPEEDLGNLQQRRGLIVIDEVQREPALFSLLRPLLDDSRRKARYLLLGSASPDVVRGVSESLAGRAGFVDLAPFLAAEVAAGPARLLRLWSRGGLPRSFLARSDAASLEWREAYLRAVLERDVPALRPGLDPAAVRGLLGMLAHVHGGVFNAAELASGLSVSGQTVSRQLDLLDGLFVVRRLQPYFVNIGKRLTKAPKIYLRDAGLLHSLLGLADLDALRGHPKVGASWEGFVIEQVIGTLSLLGEKPRPFFWRTHGGAEVDLLLEIRGRLIPIEIKLSGAPTVSRGLIECMKDLSLRAGIVLHGGESAFPLGRRVYAVPASVFSRPERLHEALLQPERHIRRA